MRKPSVSADGPQEALGDVGAGHRGAAGAELRAEALEQLLGEEVVARLVHRREHAAQRRRALRAGERRGDGHDAAGGRVRDAHAGGAEPLGERGRGGERRVGHVAAVAGEALVERQGRERPAVGEDARPPVGDTPRCVEVAFVGDHAAGDARHPEILESGDQVLDVAGLHAVVPLLERRGGEGGIAEAAQVDVAVHDALLVGPRGVDEELGAEAEAGGPGGERRRRGDELLVGGRQAQHVRPQLVDGALRGEVVDGDRGARAGHPVAGQGRRDAVLEARGRDAGREEEEREGQARQDDEQPGPGCPCGLHRGPR